MILFGLYFTFADMMNQRCKDYCLYVENELGAYFESSDSCYCGYLISNEKLSERKIHLPNKRLQIKTDTMPYKEPDSKLQWE